MTDEEKKEFEEFLQWKAEKKKKEEEEKREQEKLEKLAEQAKQERLVAEQAKQERLVAEQAKQERLVAEQAKAKQQATNPSTPNKWTNEKSEHDKFVSKALFFVCSIMIVAFAIILARKENDPYKSPATVAKENIQKKDSIDAILAAQTEKEEKAAYKERVRLDSIRKANRIDQVKHSVKILKAYLSSPNSAGGVDAHLVWKNVSKKTIKYLNWSGYPINAVGDAVECEIRGVSESGGRVTGPIKPGTTYGYGKYWECLWYNYSAKKLVLTGINIEYMDGSTMRINQNELKYIR